MPRLTRQLVGRDEVVREVGERLAGGTSCVIRGDAGIGKSAVMRAVRAKSTRATATGAGLPALTYVPYGALRQPLPDLASPEIVTASKTASDVLDRLADRQLVIEDLHWCDADTIDVLLQLCLVRPVLATARLSPSPADVLIARIEEVGHAVTLPPLDDDAARTLIASARPGAIPSDVERWIRAAGGNPLLLEVAATHGSAPSVTDPLAALTAAIPPGLVQPAARLALVGRPLPIDAVPEASDLVALGLAISDGATVAIRHDLLGQAVVALISDRDKAALHGALADELEDPAERARHFDAAGRQHDAAAAGRIAAASATSIAARAECLRIAATNTETRADPGLAVDAAEMLVWASRFPPALELVQTDGPWWGEHSTHRMMVLVRVNAALGDFDAEIRAIDAGLELLDGTGTDDEVELLTMKSRYLARVGWKHAEAIELADRALAMAESDRTKMMALSARGSSAMAAGDPSWEASLGEAIEIAARTDNPLGAAFTDSMFIGLLLNGDARRCEPLALLGVERWGGDLSYWDAQFRKNALLAAFHIAGDYRRVLDEGPRLLARPIAHRAREHLEATLMLAYSDTGDDQRALGLAETAVGVDTPDLTARSMYLWSLAEVHFQMGNIDAAADAAEACVEVPLPGFPGFTNGAVIGAWCRLLRGEPVTDAHVDLARSQFVNLAAAPLECEAIAALGRGDNEDAVRTFGAAATGWRRMSRRSALRCEIAAGAAARRGGRLDRAHTLLMSVAAEARTIGAVRHAGWAQRELRRAGSSPNEVAGHGARGVTSTAGVTSRELEVLELVGRGLRTPEIARRLSLRPSTVESYVRSALKRTGAANRLQAAATVLLGADPVSRASGHITDDPETFVRAVTRARADDATLREPDTLETEPWDLAALDLTLTAMVRGHEDLARVVLAASRGVNVIACVPESPPLFNELLDNLLRILGLALHIERETTASPLPASQVRILDLLAAGLSIAEVARRLGFSRRTVERRLEAARKTLGVETNAAAVLARSSHTSGTSGPK